MTDLRALQATVGNRTSLDWLSRAQAKLLVGSASDAYELEADRVAREVADSLAGQGTTPLHAGASLQRRAEVGAEGGPVEPATEQAIGAARRGGSPLDPATRVSMEDAFGGADFGAVRLHAGEQSAQLNDRIAARAFTLGSDIFFRGPVPDPVTRTGQELLAHELTHTIQQGGARAPDNWVLGVQRTAGNRAATALLRGVEPGVQRRIAVTEGQLSAVRGRFEGPLIGKSTFDKLRSALKAYHNRPARSDALPQVDVILGLAEHWLAKYGQSDEPAHVNKREVVEQVQAEAFRERGVLLAQQKYLAQMKTQGNFKASIALEGEEAENVYAGKTGATGGKEKAQAIIDQYKLTAAELAAIRQYSLGDYDYINPAVANSPSWMEAKQGAVIKQKDPLDYTPLATAVPVDSDLAWQGMAMKAPPAPSPMLRTFIEEGSLHGAMVLQAFEKLPVWRGVAWRGARYTPGAVASDFAPGKTIPFNAFGSSSKTREVAQEFANGKGGAAPERTASVMVALTVRNGRDIEHLSAFGTEEREVLLPPGSVFTITQLDKQKSGPKGDPEAKSWFVAYATQSDSAAKEASPAVGDKKPTTEGGTVLPDDAVGQVALSKAFEMIEGAGAVEEKVTGDLQSIAAASGMKMKGLENKFKSEPSLARKLADRARTRVSGNDVAGAVEDVVASTFDTLRYTFIVPSRSYARVAKTLDQDLAAKGSYMLVNNFNAWEESESYKGINQGYVVSAPPKGKKKGAPIQVAFEVQLHTDETFKTKSAIHEDYEEWRDPSTPKERRKELSDQMAESWKKVKVPAGIKNKAS